MNSKIGSSLVLLALSLGLFGCNPPSSTPPGNTAPSTDKKASGSATDKSATNASPDVASVPADLKHDGYAYNGFDRTAPLNYTFTQVQGEKGVAGTQTSVLKSVDKDSATFAVQRAGSLEDLGDENLLVKADGVYLVSATRGTPKSPILVMPASVKPGVVWNYDYELATKDGGKMTFKGKARAAKEEKVTTPAGEFDTMLVMETAELNTGASKGTASSKTWYAKGIGVVRMKMEVKQSNGKIASSTIELSSTGGK